MCTGVGTITTTISLNACVVTTPDGSITYDATVVLTGPGLCALRIPTSGTAMINLTALHKSVTDQPRLTNDTNVTGAYTATLVAGGPCAIGGLVHVTKVAFDLTGTLESTLPSNAGMTSLNLTGTSVEVTINSYSGDCVPDDYTLKLNGEAQGAQSAGGASISFDVNFDNFIFDAQYNGTATRAEISGAMSSVCFGGTAHLSTPSVPLILTEGEICPDAGALLVVGVGKVIYTDGMVDIDLGPDDVVDQHYNSCLAAALIACIG